VARADRVCAATRQVHPAQEVEVGAADAARVDAHAAPARRRIGRRTFAQRRAAGGDLEVAHQASLHAASKAARASTAERPRRSATPCSVTTRSISERLSVAGADNWPTSVL